ncbi:hypothetical protein Golob_013997 [Gossypium lobatum]|uniref:Uncharacterized protein n=2 Tax=Gossypium TaxID=3633 RepID=A0A7J8X180_GOSAI|nr:hypothetical protein [Gossypium lobatum]MBA0680880.1 hypothetical protein [Gossypium aridum]
MDVHRHNLHFPGFFIKGMMLPLFLEQPR